MRKSLVYLNKKFSLLYLISLFSSLNNAYHDLKLDFILLFKIKV